MPFYERGAVRIHYEETGSGFPVLFIPGGGLNSNIASLTGFGPFCFYVPSRLPFQHQPCLFAVKL